MEINENVGSNILRYMILEVRRGGAEHPGGCSKCRVDVNKIYIDVEY